MRTATDPVTGTQEGEAPRGEVGQERPAPDPEVLAKPTRRQFTAKYRLRIVEEAVVMGDRLELLDHEPLWPGGKPGSGACAVAQGGNSVEVPAVAVAYNTVTLILGTALSYGVGQASIKLSDAVPVANRDKVQDHNDSRWRCLAKRLSA